MTKPLTSMMFVNVSPVFDAGQVATGFDVVFSGTALKLNSSLFDVGQILTTFAGVFFSQHSCAGRFDVAVRCFDAVC